MAQAASIVVNDRAATPVAHTFAPRSITTDQALFVEAGSVPIGERRLIIDSRFTNGKYRIRLRVVNPTLVTEVVNGVNVPKVPRTSYGESSFTFDQTSTDQERKDTVAYIANALLASQTIPMGSIVGLEGVW